MKINEIILGSIVAIFSFLIIVYAIETDKSLLYMFLGFLFFILPITFISSFESTVPIFILVLFSAFFCYGMYKFEYYDALLGVLLAFIIGGSIAYFRINKYTLFSPEQYNHDTRNEKITDAWRRDYLFHRGIEINSRKMLHRCFKNFRL